MAAVSDDVTIVKDGETEEMHFDPMISFYTKAPGSETAQLQIALFYGSSSIAIPRICGVGPDVGEFVWGGKDDGRHPIEVTFCKNGVGISVVNGDMGDRYTSFDMAPGSTIVVCWAGGSEEYRVE